MQSLINWSECSESFFGRGNELRTCRGNILLMDNKHRKLYVIKQWKGCKFISEMHQNTFGGRAPPWPAWGANALPSTGQDMSPKLSLHLAAGLHLIRGSLGQLESTPQRTSLRSRLVHPFWQSSWLRPTDTGTRTTKQQAASLRAARSKTLPKFK